MIGDAVMSICWFLQFAGIESGQVVTLAVFVPFSATVVVPLTTVPCF